MTGSERKWWGHHGGAGGKGGRRQATGRALWRQDPCDSSEQARGGEDTPERDGDVINRVRCTRHRSGGLLTGSSFPDSSVGKESACNAGDPSLIPGSGRSAGEGMDYQRRDRLPTPVFWPGEFHGLHSPCSDKESDVTD